MGQVLLGLAIIYGLAWLVADRRPEAMAAAKARMDRLGKTILLYLAGFMGFLWLMGWLAERQAGG